MGTLIFVGIMFTAVIPMMLVMRQADTLHEMRKHELDILDQDRAMESLYLYVCPEGQDSSYVDVTMVNKGEVPAHVVNIWINDTQVPVDANIPSLSEDELGPFELDRVEGREYDIRATTDRGNIFPSETGILHYGEDGWDIEIFSIRILVSRRTWNLHIQVWIGDSPEGDPYYDQRIRWRIGSAYEIIVPQQGDYYVKITRRWGSPLFDGKVTIEWPQGEPWVWIFA